MTEDEAREKFCPIKVSEYGQDRCVASSCMMWQSTDNEYQLKPLNDTSPLVRKLSGYCGLAK